MRQNEFVKRKGVCKSDMKLELGEESAKARKEVQVMDSQPPRQIRMANDHRGCLPEGYLYPREGGQGVGERRRWKISFLNKKHMKGVMVDRKVMTMEELYKWSKDKQTEFKE